MVPAGSTLTFDVKGTAGDFIPRTADEVRAGIANSLTPFVHVYDIAIKRAGFLADPENLYYWSWGFTAVVTLQTRVGYARSEDISSIVAHAVYTASGTMPVVTVRGDGPQQTPDETTGPGLLSSLTTLAVLAVVAVVAWTVAPMVRRA